MEKRNRLVDTKLRNTIKKVVLKESKVLTNDSKLITEGKKIIVNFHKIKKRKLKEGYSKREINEDFTDWLKSLFTSDDKDETSNDIDADVDSESEDGEESSTMKKTFVDSAAQWMIGFILEQLGVTGELNRILKIALSDIDIEDYPKLLDPVDNCKWLSDVLFDGIMEYIVQVASESMLGLKNSGSIVSTSFSKAFANLTSNSQFKTDMKRYVSMAICDALGGQSGEFELSSELGRSDLDPEMVSGIKEKL